MAEVTPPSEPAASKPAGSDNTAETVPPPRQRRSRLMLVVQGLSLGVVALLLGLLIWRVAFANGGGRLVDAVSHGKRPLAPAFSLGVIWPRDELWPKPLRRALDDHVVSLNELRGYPVVINFWASWCVPCKDEAPILNAAARSQKGAVAFVGIDIQDFVSDAHKFLRQLRVPYVSVRDKGRTYSAYGLTGVPETYYLDRQGRIVGHSIGAVSRQELAQQLAKLTRETSK